MFQDVLAPINQYGPAVGASVICVGLFVASLVLSYQTRSDMTARAKKDDANFADLKQLVVSSIETQRIVAAGLERIAESIQHQTEAHNAQLDFLKEMSADQKVMLANQTTAQAGSQRLLEQLVDRTTAKD
jgi:Flp pilus assembly protein TadB